MRIGLHYLSSSSDDDFYCSSDSDCGDYGDSDHGEDDLCGMMCNRKSNEPTIECNSCVKSYHLNCVGLRGLTDPGHLEDWTCPPCQLLSGSGSTLFHLLTKRRSDLKRTEEPIAYRISETGVVAVTRLIGAESDDERPSKKARLMDESDDSEKVKQRVNFPGEILEKIFLNVNSADLGECARVCKSWNALFEDDLFWKKLLVANYGGNNLTAPRRGSFRKDFREFSVFQNMPNPTRKKSPRGSPLNPDGNKLFQAKCAWQCVFSNSGKYVAVLENEEMTDRKCSCGDVLKVFFTEPDARGNGRFRCERVLNYRPVVNYDDDDNENDRQGFSGKIEPPEFNSSDEWMFVVCSKSSTMDYTGTELLIFDLPGLTVVRQIAMNISPESLPFYNAVWLGLSTVIGRASVASNWDAPTPLKVWSANSESSTTLVPEYGNCHISILNNTRDGRKELLALKSDGWLCRLSIRGHEPEASHQCEKCSSTTSTGGQHCVTASFTSADPNFFSLEGEKSVANVGSGTVETKFDNRLFVFNKDVVVEYDLSLAKIRTVPVIELLQLDAPSTCNISFFNIAKISEWDLIDCCNGLFIFSSHVSGSEFKITMWDPMTDSTAHRVVGKRNKTYEWSTEKWYFHSEQKLFLVAHKRMKSLFYALAN